MTAGCFHITSGELMIQLLDGRFCMKNHEAWTELILNRTDQSTTFSLSLPSSNALRLDLFLQYIYIYIRQYVLVSYTLRSKW